MKHEKHFFDFRQETQLLQGCGHQECKNSVCYTGRCNTSIRPVRKHTPRSARALALGLLYSTNRGKAICWDGLPPDSFDFHEIDELPKDELSLTQQCADTAILRHFTGFHKGELDEPVFQDQDLVVFLSASALKQAKLPPFLLDGRLNPSFVENEGAAERCLNVLCLLLTDSVRQDLDFLPVLGDDPTIEAVRDVLFELPGERRLDLLRKTNLVRDMVIHHPYLPLVRDTLATISSRVLLDDVRQKTLRAPAQQPFLEILTSKLHDHINSFGNSEALMLLLEIFFAVIWRADWDGAPIFRRGSATTGYLELSASSHKHSGPIWFLQMPVNTTHDAPDSLLGPVNLLRTFYAQQKVPYTESRHFLHFKEMFDRDGEAIRALYRMQSIICMRSATMTATLLEGIAEAVSISMFELPESAQSSSLIIEVRRDHILEDAFDQLYRREDTEFRRPLRVALKEYDGYAMGQDLGGVQVEFFSLVFEQIMREESGFFVLNDKKTMSYIRPGSLQPLHLFEQIGMLFGLALYNGITIPVSLPKVFYQHIHKVNLIHCLDISDYWAEQSNSLAKLAETPAESLQLDYSLSFEANGLRVTMSRGQPLPNRNGSNPMPDVYGIVMDNRAPASNSSASEAHTPHNGVVWVDMVVKLGTSEPILDVTDDNKQTFIQDYKDCLTYWSVRPQLEALKRGFHRVVPSSSIAFLTPLDLQKMIEGTTEIDVAALRSQVLYEGFAEEDALIQAFWSMLESWPNDRRRALVRFVTAADRVPASGSNRLTFKIVRTPLEPGVLRLPTSSTCFGTLYLPEYENSTIMEDMINKALDYGEQGFGNR